jgi:hypothetical protein
MARRCQILPVSLDHELCIPLELMSSFWGSSGRGRGPQQEQPSRFRFVAQAERDENFPRLPIDIKLLHPNYA